MQEKGPTEATSAGAETGMTHGSAASGPAAALGSAPASPPAATAPPTSTSRTPGHKGVARPQNLPQLSCTMCRDRKLKCDKLDPCTNCSSSGLTCVAVYRPRLPRGRRAAGSGQRNPSISSSAPVLDHITVKDQPTTSQETLATANKKLTERVQWLESKVKEIDSSTRDDPVQHSITSPVRSDSSEAVEQAQHDLSFDLGQDFPFGDPYVGGVEALDQVPFDGDGGLMAIGFHGSTLPAFPPMPTSKTCLLLQDDPKVISAKLCGIYIENVDPVIKILHRPSLVRWMIQGGTYLGYSEDHTALEALRSAVFYSASVSMTDESCKNTFAVDKQSLAKACRTDCEMAISRSALLTSRDITVLQAFVLYLTAKRTEDHTTAVWALFALVVRIAKSLGLHKDVDESDNFFDQQMRKRLWLTICLLDLQASLMQSSEPLISHDEAASALAVVRNINDSDFDLNTTQPHASIRDSEGLTDTTFALVTYRVQLAGRVLHFTPAHNRDWSSRASTNDMKSMLLPDPDWRQRHVRQFEQEALSLLHYCDPESSTYAWFTWHSTQCLISAVRLAAAQRARLPRGQLSLPTMPFALTRSTAGPEMDADPELLQRALHHLEKVKVMHTNPRGAGYRWYITIPLPTLVIAISQCLICTDAAVLHRAWSVIQVLYQRIEHGPRISAGKPLEQLMHQMREKMAALQTPTSSEHPLNVAPLGELSIDVHTSSPMGARRDSTLQREDFALLPLGQSWSLSANTAEFWES